MERRWRPQGALTAGTWRTGSRPTPGVSKRLSATREFMTRWRCTRPKSCGLKSTTCKGRRGEIRRATIAGLLRRTPRSWENSKRNPDRGGGAGFPRAVHAVAGIFQRPAAAGRAFEARGVSGRRALGAEAAERAVLVQDLSGLAGRVPEVAGSRPGWPWTAKASASMPLLGDETPERAASQTKEIKEQAKRERG